MAGKPLSNRLCGARPIRGFSGAQEKPEHAKRAKPACERSQNCRSGIKRHGQSQTLANTYRIEKTAGDGLPQRISGTERDDEERKRGIIPAKISFDVRGKHA